MTPASRATRASRRRRSPWTWHAVLLTRDADSDIGLDARAAIANNNKADLFLSLHVNGSPSATVSGAEAQYLQLDREGLAVREEAAREAVAIPVLGGGVRTIDIIPWELAQARHVEHSAAFAAMIAEALQSRVMMGPSPVRPLPLRLLEGLNMPAVTVEMAYLTNPDQEKLVASENYKNTVAQALLDAITRFRTHMEEQRPR